MEYNYQRYISPSVEYVFGGVRVYYKLPEESGPPKFRTSGTVDVTCAMVMCTQSILPIPTTQKKEICLSHTVSMKNM